MSVSLADLVAQILKEGEPKPKVKVVKTWCPSCKVNPRVVSARGIKGPYCKQCAKEKMKIYRSKRVI